MLIVGIDPGTKKTGMVELCFDGSRFHYMWCDHVLNESVHSLIQTSHLVAIEAPGGSMFGGGARSANVVRASYWAGWFACIANSRGCRVVEATANEWRKAIVGRANAKDALIKSKVVPAIVGWPKVSNSHVRDAAGMAMFAARMVAGRVAA